jgi:hypothetical protein
MKTLCIVPCGKKKIWEINPNVGPTRARDVYIGPFAKKCREYAEKFFPFSWCILSAKYGFLFPDEIVPGPYNVTFNDKSTNPISSDELSNQVIEKGLDRYDKIVVLGSRKYLNIIKAVFQHKEINALLVNTQGIGYMMEKLNKAIRRGIPL